ncbi:hypothetical protein F4804DRAFT_347629 [Jackrogersella minutella]|nr:hypothetical protein F4804DRAFT_347629 [Jackrogersella minutella]
MAAFIQPPIRDRYGRNIKHRTFRKYAPFGDYQNVTLFKNAYKARNLLNYTVAAFYKRPVRRLTRRQCKTADDFERMLREREGAYGIKLNAITSLTSFQGDVEYLFHQLDGYFFFNALQNHISIKSGLANVGDDPLGIDIKFEEEAYAPTEGDGEHFQINVNIGANGHLYELTDIVGRLLHEMVHAYLQIFVCNCVKCSKGIIDTVKVDHDMHSHIFSLLHHLIVADLKEWGHYYQHDSLKELLADDCLGLRIRKRSNFQPEEGSKKMGQAKVNFRSFPYIYLSQNGEEVIVDQFRFIDRQTHLENYLRKETERREKVRLQEQALRENSLREQMKRKVKSNLDISDSEDEVKGEGTESDADSTRRW